MTSYRQPGVVLTDRRFTVPLDHSDPGGEQIEVYGREAVAASRAGEELPWLVYLEGGPGFGARRFVGTEAWLGRALREFRVLLLDQRGTGLSTPANRQTLPLRGRPARAGRLPRPLPLRLHRPRLRADPAAAHRRSALDGPRPVLRRLLRRPLPLRRPGRAQGGPDHRRAALAGRARGRRLPGRVPPHRAEGRRPLRPLPAGRRARPRHRRPPRRAPARERRTPADPEGFQSLGILLGTGSGSHQLHYLLENAFVRTPGATELSDTFQEAMRTAASFAGHPLYALLHEAIYGQGERATDWAAERVREEFPQFDAATALRATAPSSSPARRSTLALRRRPGAAAPARDRRAAGPAHRLAGAVRPRAARRQRGSGRGGRLPRRHVRRHRGLAAHGGGDPGAADLGDGRVRARRSPRGRPRVLDRLLALVRDEA